MNPFRVLAALSFLIVSGCSSSPTILSSLEDLTSETERQGLSLTNQNRILSITGLLPHAQVGSYYRYDHDRSPSTAIGISQDDSFLIESTIPAASEAVANKVLDKIADVREAARLSLESLIASIGAKGQLASAESKDPPPDNLDALRQAAKAAADKYAEARKAFDAALSTASRLIKDSGFLVIRWDARSREAGSASALPIFSGAFEETKQTSGFAILSGLRLMTLFVGKDILAQAFPLKETWWFYGDDVPWIFSLDAPFIGQWSIRDFRLTTHLLQTQRVQYFQDADIAREATVAIEASYEQLSSLEAALSEVDKIEVDYISEGLASLSNLGSLKDVERSFFPAPLTSDGKKGVKAAEAKIVGAWSAATRPEQGADGGVDEKKFMSSLMDMQEDLRKAGASGGTCLSFTGRCIEEQIVERKKRKLAGLAPSMDGWLTIYAVDVDAHALRKQFR